MLKQMVLAAALVVSGGLFAEENALVGHWPCNEGEGKIIKDASGHNLNGEVANAEFSKWVDGRQGGKALALGGPNGKGVSIYIDKVPISTLKNGYTVSCFFRPDADAFKRNSIWYLICNSRSAKGFMLGIHFQRLLFGGSGNQYTHSAASNYAKNPFKGGEWVHFAGTYDGKGVYKVYIDGALAGVSTGAACGPVDGGYDALCIGSQYNYGPAIGAICDVKLFNRPLTDDEVMQESLAE